MKKLLIASMFLSCSCFATVTWKPNSQTYTVDKYGSASDVVHGHKKVTFKSVPQSTPINDTCIQPLTIKR